jgi:hypothetical protein
MKGLAESHNKSICGRMAYDDDALPPSKDSYDPITKII